MKHKLQELPGHPGFHPTSAAISELADTLANVYNHAPEVFHAERFGSGDKDPQVAMMCEVPRTIEEDGHVCGTVACFAGWAAMSRALAAGRVAHAEIEGSDEDENIMSGPVLFKEADCTYVRTSFHNAVDDLEAYLGFENHQRYALDAWASENPRLWGNEWGRRVYTDGAAFGQRSDEFGLSAIVHHLRGVAERLEAAEAAQ